MITLLIATLCIVAVITGIIIYYTNNTVLIKTNPNQVFGFKTSIELTGLPIIVFYQNNKKYNFSVNYESLSESGEKVKIDCVMTLISIEKGLINIEEDFIKNN